MTSLQRQAPPRSILLPSPTKPNYDLPLQHPYPARYPRDSSSSPSSTGYATTTTPNIPAGSTLDMPGRRRTSITIEERPRIVVRPLVGNIDSQRRNRRRSSAGSATSATSPVAQQFGRGKDEAGEHGGNLAVASVTRKTSTGKAFANLFRKKKGTNKDETDAPGPLKGKDISVVSLEGEIMEYGSTSADQTTTINAMRKRALSSSPESRQPSNKQQYQASETSLKPNFPAAPIRRVSESDVERRQQTHKEDASTRFHRPMLTLNMRTQSAITPARIGSPIALQTPTMSPNLNDGYGHDPYQPRRRSSTRLVSPSASGSSRGKSSSRVTSPTSPGFSTFQGFTAPSASSSPRMQSPGYASDVRSGFHSPTSPMSTSPVFSSPQHQYPANSAPFSLMIRRESEGIRAPQPQQQQPRVGSAPSRSSTEFGETVEEETLQQKHAFDPAQFDDGSDSESGAERRNTIPQRTTPSPETSAMREKRTSSGPYPVDPTSSGLATPILTEIPITVISASDSAPLMQRSESGPPPTFKFIPATPIAPENKDEEGDSGGSQRGDGSTGGESQRKKNRNSLPPVPVNPIRPRKLELVLDLNTTPDKIQASRRTESDSTPVQPRTPISALDSLLNDNAFYDPDTTEAFDEAELADYSRTSSSPPVRSPSRESLMRNTVPLRLSTSPRLVTATDVCRPVNSSLSMASSCQSSHALTLSSSSTIASSLDSIHTLDLEDVESALGSMLASLSTRPSLASRLTLTDPQLADSRELKSNERAPPPPEMELSALGFGQPSMHTSDYEYNSETPTRRDHRRSWAPRNDFAPATTYASEYITRRDSYDEADAEVNDSETDSIFSDIDDLGSVSIAVVHKKSPGMFASPRTMSMEATNTNQLQR
ncbi:hypothetical protein QFC21_007175 [Naganishia friedmannii]|uniref:Uncharacterized protein n=1 Tax=Naganishia friedmannii TaxID=89922 RepID=A0ACC2UXC8_9TREE|nr:hypothetical protein QFC21_007175 [Naganishia friedmannii]